MQCIANAYGFRAPQSGRLEAVDPKRIASIRPPGTVLIEEHEEPSLQALDEMLDRRK